MSWSEVNPVVVVGLYVIRERFSSIWIQYLILQFYLCAIRVHVFIKRVTDSLSILYPNILQK